LSLNDLKTTIHPDLLLPKAEHCWPNDLILILKTNWF